MTRGLVARDGRQPLGDGLPLLLAHSRSQDDQMADA